MSWTIWERYTISLYLAVISFLHLSCFTISRRFGSNDSKCLRNCCKDEPFSIYDHLYVSKSYSCILKLLVFLFGSYTSLETSLILSIWVVIQNKNMCPFLWIFINQMKYIILRNLFLNSYFSYEHYVIFIHNYRFDSTISPKCRFKYFCFTKMTDERIEKQDKFFEKYVLRIPFNVISYVIC